MIVVAWFPSLKHFFVSLPWCVPLTPYSGALFFSAKDAFSTAISNVSGGQYADLTTVVAVGLAQFPYWGIRTPAELLKIR